MSVAPHEKMENMDNLNTDKKLSSSQLRKIKKPLIEKRRRERINESLSQLKSLILEALNKDESQYNKMEKADILELTVKHLKNLHKQPSALPTQAPVNQTILQPVQFQAKEDNVQDYKAGFAHCASEVQRYMQSVNVVKSDVTNHVVNHLNSRVHDLASPTHNNENQENLTQSIGATYVQILPKDTNALTGNGENLSSQMIQGIPYLQSIPLLNGQTIFVASAVPNLGTQQVQPMLQLAQPVITNTNLNQQSTVSPNYMAERPKQETHYESNNINSSVINNRNNDTTNYTYKQQELTSAESLHAINMQNNGRNNRFNLNVQPSKSSTQSHASRESNASPLSMKTYEHRLINQQTSFTNRNINTLNFNHIQPTSNKEYHRAPETKQTHKSVPDNVNHNNFVYNNHFSKPQCLDPMWRPW